MFEPNIRTIWMLTVSHIDVDCRDVEGVGKSVFSIPLLASSAKMML